jgi:DNA-binding MarR family transcriptional regulator
MSARGLLLIEDDRHDRRRRRIHLTAKGRQMRHQAVDTMEAAVVRTFSHMPPGNLAITRNVLTLLADNLGPIREE